MRLINGVLPTVSAQGSVARRVRQIAVLAATLLGACSSEEPQLGRVGFVKGFLGGVAADEPRAALVGRDILSAGGNAVDAATAVYFALSVTLPSSASLGGGGVCAVRDARRQRTESIEFIAGAPGDIPASASRPSALPGNARGFYSLHSRYGALPWSQLVAPAENLARFGTSVSRALAQDLAKVGDALLADPASRVVFGRADGGMLQEGDFLQQVELAGVLSRLRNLGPGDFYNGQTARLLASAAAQAGGSISLEELRLYAPTWRNTIKLPFGNQTVHFTAPPAAAGGTAAVMWVMLTERDLYEDAHPDLRPHVLAEVAMRAFADRGRWMQPDGSSTLAADELPSAARLRGLIASFAADRHLPAEQLSPPPATVPENPAATSLVVVDRDGSAVACALTMNNAFGIGRIAPGSGILLAMAPGPPGRGPYSLGAMLVINERVNEFFYASAASGGMTAPTAMIAVAAATLLGQVALEDALAAPRVHHGGAPDLLYHEPDLDPARLRALADRGHRLGATPQIGRVNGVHCAEGLPRRSGSCAIRTDPRGFGLAASAD